MNREDELQGIIDFQTKEIKELKEENKELQEILHYGNIDKTMVSVIGKAIEEKRIVEQALKGEQK